MPDVIDLRPRPDEHRCPLPKAHADRIVMCGVCDKVWRTRLVQSPGRPDRWAWRRVRWLAWWYRLDAPEVPAR